MSAATIATPRKEKEQHQNPLIDKATESPTVNVCNRSETTNNTIIRKWGPGAGMTNTQRTCWLNSTLQALFHIPAFVDWLLCDDVVTHRRTCQMKSKRSKIN